MCSDLPKNECGQFHKPRSPAAQQRPPENRAPTGHKVQMFGITEAAIQQVFLVSLIIALALRGYMEWKYLRNTNQHKVTLIILGTLFPVSSQKSLEHKVPDSRLPRISRRLFL